MNIWQVITSDSTWKIGFFYLDKIRNNFMIKAILWSLIYGMIWTITNKFQICCSNRSRKVFSLKKSGIGSSCLQIILYIGFFHDGSSCFPNMIASWNSRRVSCTTQMNRSGACNGTHYLCPYSFSTNQWRVMWRMLPQNDCSCYSADWVAWIAQNLLLRLFLLCFLFPLQLPLSRISPFDCSKTLWINYPHYI